MTVITGPTQIAHAPSQFFARIPLFHGRVMVFPAVDAYEPPSTTAATTTAAITTTAAWEKPEHPTEEFASAVAQGKWDRAYCIITDYELLTGDVNISILAPQIMSAFQSTADTTPEERVWMVRLALSLLETIPFFEISPAIEPLRSVLENSLVQTIFAAAPGLDQETLFACCKILQGIPPFEEYYRTVAFTAATSYAIEVFQIRFPDVPLDISLHDARVAQETPRCTVPACVDTLIQYTQQQPAPLRTTTWRVVGELMHSDGPHKIPQIQLDSICTGCSDETPLSFRATRCTNESVSFCQSCFVQGIRTSTRIETDCPCGCKDPLCYADFLLAGLSHQNAEDKAIENLRKIFSRAPEWINCNNTQCSGGALRSQENIAPWNILQKDSVLQSACCLCESDCGISLTASFDEHYIKRMLVSLGPWTFYFGTFRNILDGVWHVPGPTGEHGIREAYPHQLAGISTEKGPNCEHMTTPHRTSSGLSEVAHWYWCSGATPRNLLGQGKVPELTWYLNDNCQLFLPERSPIIAPLGGYRVRDDHGDFISLYDPITFVLDAQLYRTHALKFLLHRKRKTPIPSWLETGMGSIVAQQITTRHALIDFLENQIPCNNSKWNMWRPVHAFLLTFEAHVVRKTYLRRNELLKTYKRHVRGERA